MINIAIVSGGSGLIGTQLLHQLFLESKYDYVISVARRELSIKNHKLIQVKVDFENFGGAHLEESLRSGDLGGDNHGLIKHLKDKTYVMHSFCALGTTIKKAGSKEAFFKIDHDYVINFAKWAKELGAKKFLYVSSLGADAGSSIFYNQVKGQVEEDLKKIGFDYLGIFQPSILLGDRKESRLGEDIGKVVMRLVTAPGLFKKYKPIYDHKVAKAMLYQALEKSSQGVEIISSVEMQAFG
ncbi:NAD-dependent epimerase/dehydratase family protein [Pararhodonellum marinum]|uniref:NAD-dependent epimerase/dehydratase family protein n=1 Tax=Pararhodonellum marinum TaxID=2755358 RepID=UPI00188EC13E|nr:NAD-dependent epimerase/dehydratase family protein [Pararhodonellum marinum]